MAGTLGSGGHKGTGAGLGAGGYQSTNTHDPYYGYQLEGGYSALLNSAGNARQRLLALQSGEESAAMKQMGLGMSMGQQSMAAQAVGRGSNPLAQRAAIYGGGQLAGQIAGQTAGLRAQELASAYGQEAQASQAAAQFGLGASGLELQRDTAEDQALLGQQALNLQKQQQDWEKAKDMYSVVMGSIGSVSGGVAASDKRLKRGINHVNADDQDRMLSALGSKFNESNLPTGMIRDYQGSDPDLDEIERLGTEYDASSGRIAAIDQEERDAMTAFRSGLQPPRGMTSEDLQRDVARGHYFPDAPEAASDKRARLGEMFAADRLDQPVAAGVGAPPPPAQGIGQDLWRGPGAFNATPEDIQAASDKWRKEYPLGGYQAPFNETGVLAPERAMAVGQSGLFSREFDKAHQDLFNKQEAARQQAAKETEQIVGATGEQINQGTVEPGDLREMAYKKPGRDIGGILSEATSGVMGSERSGEGGEVASSLLGKGMGGSLGGGGWGGGGGGRGWGGGGGGGGGMTEIIDTKTMVEHPAGGGKGTTITIGDDGSFIVSDERSKQLAAAGVTDAEQDKAMRAMETRRFEYTPEAQQQFGLPGGERPGITAQELERSKLGREMTTTMPGGFKGIDRDAAIGTTLGLLGRVDERLRALEGDIPSRGGGQAPSPGWSITHGNVLTARGRPRAPSSADRSMAGQRWNEGLNAARAGESQQAAGHFQEAGGIAPHPDAARNQQQAMADAEAEQRLYDYLKRKAAAAGVRTR